jgi:hypothetical protein
MRCLVMLGEVVAEVLGAGSPVDDKLVLFDAIADPVEPHVHCAGFALLEGVVAIPEAVELSVLIGVGGWGWLSSSSVVRSGTASWPLTKLRRLMP